MPNYFQQGSIHSYISEKNTLQEDERHKYFVQFINNNTT